MFPKMAPKLILGRVWSHPKFVAGAMDREALEIALKTCQGPKIPVTIVAHKKQRRGPDEPDFVIFCNSVEAK